MKKVLNIGGGNKKIAIPKHYDGWEHVLLDIQDGPDVDVVSDATNMIGNIEEKSYDAIYLSHNLEHYYRHRLPYLFDGIKYAMKEGAFVEIHVPNIKAVWDDMTLKGKDIEDVAYESAMGPIKYVDMIYGMSVLIHEGNNFMMHKNGFTPKSLGSLLWTMKFNYVFIGENRESMSVVAYSFMDKPTEEQMTTLRLKNG